MLLLSVCEVVSLYSAIFNVKLRNICCSLMLFCCVSSFIVAVVFVRYTFESFGQLVSVPN